MCYPVGTRIIVPVGEDFQAVAHKTETGWESWVTVHRLMQTDSNRSQPVPTWEEAISQAKAWIKTPRAA